MHFLFNELQYGILKGNPETSSWIRVRVRVRVGLRVRLRVRLRVIYIPAFPNVPVISEQLRFLFTSSKLVFIVYIINMKNKRYVNLLYYKSFL